MTCDSKTTLCTIVHRVVKTEWWDAGMVMCLGQGADLHIAQLMPLPLTISCSSKSRLVLPFWCQLTRVVLDEIQEGRIMVVCVCVCVCVCVWMCATVARIVHHQKLATRGRQFTAQIGLFAHLKWRH